MNGFVVCNIKRYVEMPIVEVSVNFATEELVSYAVRKLIKHFDFSAKYGGTPYKNMGGNEEEDMFTVKGFIIFPTMKQAINFSDEAVNKLM